MWYFKFLDIAVMFLAGRDTNNEHFLDKEFTENTKVIYPIEQDDLVLSPMPVTWWSTIYNSQNYTFYILINFRNQQKHTLKCR